MLMSIALSLFPLIVFADEAPPTHFGLLEAAVDFHAAQQLGIQWVRGQLWWDMVQRGPNGDLIWEMFDGYVKDAQLYGFEILIILFPFAPWDQERCHAGQRMLGRPCDTDAYKRFVRAAVERYDGDGADDMPGLRYPIHHWEVFNEPAMKDLPPFYDFTPKDYFELLKAANGEIKAACPQCKVVQAGVANLDPEKEQFLQSYLDLGGGDYFDIANIHFIHFGDFDTLNVGPFKEILEDYGIAKPIWVTEVQIESGPGTHYPHLSDEEAAALLVKSYIRAFSLGADKLFYVVLKPIPEFPPNVVAASLIDTRSNKRPTYFALKTMIELLGHFTDVERITDSLYRFDTSQGIIYAAWSGATLSSDTLGETVQVIDIGGEARIMSFEDTSLSDVPVYIKPAK